MSIDEHGPYSIGELSKIAAEAFRLLGKPLGAVVLPSSANPQIVYDHLISGKSVILLWRSMPMWGHFVALVPRGKTLELFDPLGGVRDGKKDFVKYLGKGGLPLELNGYTPWLGILFKTWVENTKQHISFNMKGPQPDKANSCGLWCVRRAMYPELAPAEFYKKFVKK